LAIVFNFDLGQHVEEYQDAATPAGVVQLLESRTGGVAALNRRL
jgi:hypothetical protein